MSWQRYVTLVVTFVLLAGLITVCGGYPQLTTNTRLAQYGLYKQQQEQKECYQRCWIDLAATITSREFLSPAVKDLMYEECSRRCGSMMRVEK
jgi:hypothetical protein